MMGKQKEQQIEYQKLINAILLDPDQKKDDDRQRGAVVALPAPDKIKAPNHTDAKKTEEYEFVGYFHNVSTGAKYAQYVKKSSLIHKPSPEEAAKLGGRLKS
jgi:hypothetical protein